MLSRCIYVSLWSKNKLPSHFTLRLTSRSLGAFDFFEWNLLTAFLWTRLLSVYILYDHCLFPMSILQCFYSQLQYIQCSFKRVCDFWFWIWLKGFLNRFCRISVGPAHWSTIALISSVSSIVLSSLLTKSKTKTHPVLLYNEKARTTYICILLAKVVPQITVACTAVRAFLTVTVVVLPPCVADSDNAPLYATRPICIIRCATMPLCIAIFIASFPKVALFCCIVTCGPCIYIYVCVATEIFRQQKQTLRLFCLCEGATWRDNKWKRTNKCRWNCWYVWLTWLNVCFRIR